MPVIVIGADTDCGLAVTKALANGSGEVRAFVSNPAFAQELRDLGVKVAVGDVSDSSHVEGAARRAHSAVVIAEAGRDSRERSFAASVDSLIEAWATGLKDAGVQRIIWAGPDQLPPAPIDRAAGEAVAIDVRDHDHDAVAAEVIRLDGLARLD